MSTLSCDVSFQGPRCGVFRWVCWIIVTLLGLKRFSCSAFQSATWPSSLTSPAYKKYSWHHLLLRPLSPRCTNMATVYQSHWSHTQATKNSATVSTPSPGHKPPNYDHSLHSTQPLFHSSSQQVSSHPNPMHTKSNPHKYTISPRLLLVSNYTVQSNRQM